jgi:thioredoxin-related protein
MKRSSMPRALEFFSRLALIGAMFIALATTHTRAAELVMFEQAGCSWCEAFDRDIGSIYEKTEDGLRAPLRRVDIAQPLPRGLAFLQVERLTPLFVLVDKGLEIGRIRGYGGRDMFWMQLYVLMRKLDAAGSSAQRGRKIEKALRTNT